MRTAMAARVGAPSFAQCTPLCAQTAGNLVKVIHIITELEQGGAEAMLSNIVLTATASDPHEQQHEVISLGPLGTIGARLRAKGIVVRALGLRAPVHGLAAIVRLVGLLREAGPGIVVQTWMYHADLIGGIAARLAGQRLLVWNVRQTGLGAQDIRWLTRLVVRACALTSRWLPKCIVSNSSMAVEVHARVGYKKSLFTLIPNGFDTTYFKREHEAGRELRRAWGLHDNHIVIGMVARLDPQKDHPNFIAAASAVAARLADARFVLVGRGVTSSRELRVRIAENGLEDHFVLEEQRDDIPAVMSALDIFCLSSRAEGFPNVLGEAMACETPSVTTDCGDARAVIGDAALVAPIADAGELAQRILRVAELDAAKRRSLGRTQRIRIEELFDINKVWKQYRNLYARLLDSEK